MTKLAGSTSFFETLEAQRRADQERKAQEDAKKQQVIQTILGSLPLVGGILGGVTGLLAKQEKPEFRQAPTLGGEIRAGSPAPRLPPFNLSTAYSQPPLAQGGGLGGIPGLSGLGSSNSFSPLVGRRSFAPLLPASSGLPLGLGQREQLLLLLQRLLGTQGPPSLMR